MYRGIESEFNFDLFAPLCHLFEGSGLADNISQLIPHIGSRVLLVGAGGGLVAEKLHAHGREVVGVDRSPRMCQEAFARRGLCWQCADAASFVSPRRFDTLVISTGVLTPGNVQALAPVLRRLVEGCVRPGGSCVCALFVETEFDRLLVRLGFDTADLLPRLISARFQPALIWPSAQIPAALDGRLRRYLQVLAALYGHAVAEGVLDPLGALWGTRETFRQDEVQAFCATLTRVVACDPITLPLDAEVIAVRFNV